MTGSRPEALNCQAGPIGRDLEGEMRQRELNKLKAMVAKLTDTIFCTGDSRALASTANEIGVTHRPVNVSAGRRAIAKVYNILNVNSRLKNWIRRFHGVGTKYLDSYLGWLRTLDRFPTSGLQPTSFLALALGERLIIN